MDYVQCIILVLSVVHAITANDPVITTIDTTIMTEYPVDTTKEQEVTTPGSMAFTTILSENTTIPTEDPSINTTVMTEYPVDTTIPSEHTTIPTEDSTIDTTIMTEYPVDTTIPSEYTTIPTEDPTIDTTIMTEYPVDTTIPSEYTTIPTEDPTIDTTIMTEYPVDTTIPSEYTTIPTEDPTIDTTIMTEYPVDTTIPSEYTTIPTEDPTIDTTIMTEYPVDTTIPSKYTTIPTEDPTIDTTIMTEYPVDTTIPSEYTTIPTEDPTTDTTIMTEYSADTTEKQVVTKPGSMPFTTIPSENTTIPTEEPTDGPTNSPTPSGPCKNRTNGLYPVGPCSSRFYHCSNGIAYVMLCPDPLVFDPVNSRCNYSDDVKGCPDYTTGALLTTLQTERTTIDTITTTKVACMHGGSFNDGKCVCSIHYTGTHCERLRCENQGVINIEGSKCMCTPPYSGQFCEIAPKSNCQDLLQYSHIDTNGVYQIDTKENDTVDVYCDMSHYGGGWTSIQRRMDDTDFDRSWNEYKTGFGDKAGTHWLGNDVISELTRQNDYQLLVELENCNGDWSFQIYDSFMVGEESSMYELSVGPAKGNSGDAITFPVPSTTQNKMKFSTFDQDNDQFPVGCSNIYGGGWWFNACGVANLNGKFSSSCSSTPQAPGILWYTVNYEYYSFQSVKMMIRPASKALSL